MLFEPLFAHATQTPQEIAVIDDAGRYTYQQVAAMAAGLGLYLSFQTQQPRVGLLLPPGVGYVASFYATLLAGKSVVPINYLLGDREIAHVIADSGIDTVVTIPQLEVERQVAVVTPPVSEQEELYVPIVEDAAARKIPLFMKYLTTSRGKVFHIMKASGLKVNDHGGCLGEFV